MSDRSEIENARAALAGVRTSETRLSDRTRWPFWRHAAVGIAVGALMFGQTLDGVTSIMISFGIILLALFLRNDDKKRHGMFVSGLRPGKTAWIAMTLIVLIAAGCAYVRLGMEKPQIETPEFWLLTAIMIVLTTALSYLWQRVYQSELRGDER